MNKPLDETMDLSTKRFQGGYTLTEMLVCLLISSVVVLMVGVVSGVGNTSTAHVQTKAGIYSDIAYGFKLLHNKVRSSSKLATESQSGNWLSTKLVVDGKKCFGLYQPSGAATKDFVYLPDKGNENVREVLFANPAAEAVALSFSISGKTVTAHIYGTKKKIDYDMSTTTFKRVGS